MKLASRRDLLLLACAGDSQTRDHLPKLLPGGDVGHANLTKLLQVQQRQPLREELTINDTLAKAGDDAEANATGKLVQRGADPLQIVRFDMLEPIPKHHPVDALAGLLGALGAAVPDQLGVKAGLGDLVILGMN